MNEDVRVHERVSGVVRAGFEQLMTGAQHEKLEAYFAELVDVTPGLRSVTVFSNDQASIWGSIPEGDRLPVEEIERAVTSTEPFIISTDLGP